MDFFQQSPYRINKLLLRLVGLWPHQNKCESSFFMGLALLCSGSLVCTQIRKVIIDCDNPETLIGCIAPFIVDIVCLTKGLNSILNSKKICQILERIQEDLNEKMGPEEKVMIQCVNDGRLFTILYAGWLYFSTTSFLVLPFAPKIIVALGLANISAPAQFPFPVDYFIDPEEYYVYLQIHICVGVFFIISTIVATDCMFVMLVQHGCGLFSAIGYRLENLANHGDLNIELHPNRAADEAFWIVIDCIKKHKKAIQKLIYPDELKRFAELVDSIYCWSFFFVVGCSMAALSFSGFQMVVSMSIGDTDQVICQILFGGGQLIHLFLESLFSQRLTDHSLYVYEALNRIRWYETSMRTRKLLNFMLLRSVIPFELKAGKMYTMSIENYSAVVRMSGSYFTLLCSMQ